MFCCIQVLDSFTLYMVTSLILWKSYDGLSASEATRKKWVNVLPGNTKDWQYNYSNKSVPVPIVVYCIYRSPHMYLNLYTLN